MIEAITGPLAAAAALLCLILYAASVVLRERGGAARTFSWAHARPLLVAAMVVSAGIGVLLLVLRLGVLS